MFDLVFVDPPFSSAAGDINDTLGAVCGLGLLADGACVVARSHFKTVLHEPPGGLICSREKRYGENRVLFFDFSGR